MQKKLIALAVAGLVSGGAFAQSNVTISGQLKVAVDNVSASGATAPGASLTSRNRFTDNNSNIRFSGTEGLGNGLSAIWQIETSVGTTDCTGTSGAANGACGTAGANTIGTRDTFVGLTGGFGTVMAGKLSVHYQSQVNVEGAGFVDGLPLAASTINLLNNINGTAITGSTRLNNAIGYVTPTWGGFNVLVGYTTISESTIAGLKAKDTGWNFRPRYDNGPIHATWSYLAVSNAGSSAASMGADTRSNRLGFAYDIPGGFKVGVVYDGTKNQGNDAGGVETKRTAWALPLSYTNGANVVSFSYAKAGTIKLNGADQKDTGAKMFMLGFEHALSKRTAINATWVSLSNDAAAKYDFWHPSSSVGAGSPMPAGADPRMIALGMWHKF